MSKLSRLVCLSLFLVMAMYPIFGQEYLSTKGKAIVNESGDTIILRGMGLGGWMLQEGYMLQTAGFANSQRKIKEKILDLIGPTDTEAFYSAWLDNHVRKSDIDSLKKWGFNSVRLPMHYNLYTLPIDEEPIVGQQTWLDKGFVLTDSLLSWCKSNEMYLILDLHAAPGGQGKDEGISDYDPVKPSLWESAENQDKTIALWKKLAERYVNEPWIGGYDLINETNWELPNNTALRQLQIKITDSIRSVDDKHIVFIEGNWFANDFTNMTPPWDDNMVYAPHKYWSTNDQASIQWVLDIRNTYDVPLWFGEWGENSNVWFRNAIALFEEFGIGWAVWPMKKIESIAGPVSVIKSSGYQDLLDFWNGTGSAVSASVAKSTLMDLTEKLKIENCVFQKDVIDAMFRQQTSSVAIPWTQNSIPGVVYASDYDVGPVGVAYSDEQVADFRVSTGNFTAWNNGWTYRNDGVDIQSSVDNVNSNGVNVGWIGTDEWMQYSVDIEEDGVYDVQIRIASNESGGKFHFEIDSSNITDVVDAPNTGGWETWQTKIIPNVVLSPADKVLKFYADQGTFNLGSFQFIKIGPSTELGTQFQAAYTANKNLITLNVNKRLNSQSPIVISDFEIFINQSRATITEATVNGDNSRLVSFKIEEDISADDNLTISYNGTQLIATDGTSLALFTQKAIENRIPKFINIPGRIQAEDYFFQSGIQLENTTDVGGGLNIGFLDRSDYLDYNIIVSTAGTYNVEYRTASQSEIGGVDMQIINSDGTATLLHSTSFPSTGGWQNWETTSAIADLSAGTHQLRILITEPLFNINWFEFSLSTSVEIENYFDDFAIFPNPTSGLMHLKAKLLNAQPINVSIVNISGKVIAEEKQYLKSNQLDYDIDLTGYSDGIYLLNIRMEDGNTISQKILKH